MAVAILSSGLDLSMQPAQPWTQYDFTDPVLQSLPAGQKILLRMGAENRARLKAKIREIRTLLVQPVR